MLALPETWVLYGIGCSIVMAITIMVTSVGTHHIPDLHVPKATWTKRKTNFFKGLWRTLTVSKNYRILCRHDCVLGCIRLSHQPNAVLLQLFWG